MTDEQLLRAAAKAAGIDLAWSSVEDQSPRNREGWNVWNPLEDDGDALRLAVRLNLNLEFDSEPDGAVVYARAVYDDGDAVGDESLGKDSYAATRRAITRAAAALSELGAEHFGAEGK